MRAGNRPEWRFSQFKYFRLHPRGSWDVKSLFDSARASHHHSQLSLTVFLEIVAPTKVLNHQFVVLQGSQSTISRKIAEGDAMLQDRTLCCDEATEAISCALNSCNKFQVIIRLINSPWPPGSCNL